LDIQAASSASCIIPTTLEVGATTYKLFFVQESVESYGKHFTATMIYLGTLLKFDSLGQTTPLERWPASFKFPSLLIYVQETRLNPKPTEHLVLVPQESFLFFESSLMDEIDLCSTSPAPLVQTVPVDFFLRSTTDEKDKDMETPDNCIGFNEFTMFLQNSMREHGHLADPKLLSHIFSPPSRRMISFDTISSEHTRSSIDVDSILCTGRHFPVHMGPVAFYPFANRMMNLKSNNHVEIEVDKVLTTNNQNSNSKTSRVAIVSCKHLCIARSGPSSQFVTLLVFPRLPIETFNGSWRNYMLEVDLSEFYEKIFYPTLKEVLTEQELVKLPVSYSGLCNVCRGDNGQLKFGYFLLSNRYAYRAIFDKLLTSFIQEIANFNKCNQTYN
jgi:hypothetical protein